MVLGAECPMVLVFVQPACYSPFDFMGVGGMDTEEYLSCRQVGP